MPVACRATGRFAKVQPKLPKPGTLKNKGRQQQPMQPIIQDARGAQRFRESAIARTLLKRDTDHGMGCPGTMPQGTRGDEYAG